MKNMILPALALLPLLAFGETGEIAATNAIAYVEARADAGDVDAQAVLATCYLRGAGVKMDIAKAVRLFLSAATQGNIGAQNNLAYCYANGIGVEKNDAEAVKWWRKAAEKGLAEAEYWLGASYRDGLGVEKDLVKAQHWLRLAREKGFSPSGLTEDHMAQLRQAAESGDAAAQNFLGKCYYLGEMVPLDRAEAKKWFMKSAAAGYEKAKLNLEKCME
ncbi:MAG: sel1 repeat family protein [Kiritimatiellae bacterium]|nr:sel1 repeat family protein [Kiritimatiellia bacterium]